MFESILLNVRATANVGFSWLLLFIALLFTMVWAIGMYAMWLDAYFNSRLDRENRHMGMYRAVLDLAESLQGDLGNQGSTRPLSDGQLRKKVKGGKIAYTADVDSYSTPTRRTMVRVWFGGTPWWRWMLRHKAWSWGIGSVLVLTLFVVIGKASRGAI